MHLGKRQMNGRFKLRFLKIENEQMKTVQFLWMQTIVKLLIFCSSKENLNTRKGEACSRGTNLLLPETWL